MYLEEIMTSNQLEDDQFECKSILNRDDVIGWLKSIAGFANASGGIFIIGVEDKSNKLITCLIFFLDQQNKSSKVITACILFE